MFAHSGLAGLRPYHCTNIETFRLSCSTFVRVSSSSQLQRRQSQPLRYGLRVPGHCLGLLIDLLYSKPCESLAAAQCMYTWATPVVLLRRLKCVLGDTEKERLTSRDLALRIHLVSLGKLDQDPRQLSDFGNFTKTCHCPTNSFAPPSELSLPEPLLQSQLFQKPNPSSGQLAHLPSSQIQEHSHPPQKWASRLTSTSNTPPQTVNHVSMGSPRPSFTWSSPPASHPG